MTQVGKNIVIAGILISVIILTLIFWIVNSGFAVSGRLEVVSPVVFKGILQYLLPLMIPWKNNLLEE
jgi:hypothetical protein